MEFRNWLIRNFLIGGGVVAILAIAIFFLGRDIFARVGEIKDYRRELSVRLQSVNSIASLRADAQEAEKLTVNLQSVLPPKDHLDDLSNILEREGRRNNLGLNISFADRASSTENRPTANFFKIDGAGDYGQFLRFLQAIEKSGYFIGFDSFELARKDDDFNFLISGKVFSQ